MRKTTDGEATRTAIWTGTTDGEFQGVCFVDPMRGWAVTYYGLMYRTTDGGYSWFFQDSLGRGTYGRLPMRDVQFTTPDSGWAVDGIAGDNVIARTTDAGMNWTCVHPGGSSLRENAWSTRVEAGSQAGETAPHLLDERQLPRQFLLAQNYPNPFNLGTTVSYELPRPSGVRLSVYDMLGREVSCW